MYYWNIFFYRSLLKGLVIEFTDGSSFSIVNIIMCLAKKDEIHATKECKTSMVRDGTEHFIRKTEY